MLISCAHAMLLRNAVLCYCAMLCLLWNVHKGQAKRYGYTSDIMALNVVSIGP
jgi:hypothetical protein